MNFTPKSDKEIDETGLLPAGIYQYEVISSEDARSKSGNEMIKLQLKLWTHEGNIYILYDYLLEAMPKKLKHFAVTNSLEDKYNLGTISAEDCKHKAGYAEIMVQEDKTGKYSTRNSIKDYVRKPEASKKQDFIKEQDLFDDVIPF